LLSLFVLPTLLKLVGGKRDRVLEENR